MEPVFDHLLFAVPNEDQLRAACLDLLASSGMQFQSETRRPIKVVRNFPITLIFLPARDIPSYVTKGRVHLGVTGTAQLQEHHVHFATRDRSGIEEVTELGFGRCSLQVQVPNIGGIEHAKQLIGMNLVTTFPALSEQYFARLEGMNGKTEENATVTPCTLQTKIRTSDVEAACALGDADAIIDLVDSGDTSTAAGLTSVGTIVDSVAVLIKSAILSHVRLVDLIVRRILGVVTARENMLCQYVIPRSALPRATKVAPGKWAPTITALWGLDQVAVNVVVEKRTVATVMDNLAAVGATDILVLGLANARTGVGSSRPLDRHSQASGTW